jgi:hypothetical protein
MDYRLSQHKKETIGRNLIDFIESDKELSRDAATFIGNWILTGAKEKTRAYYDVWDIVLKNYLPTTRPVLYRSCARREDGKIRSFSGRIGCVQRFSENKGFLLICDTEETLSFPELQKCGDYRHTFFPNSELLKKEAQSPDCKFSKSLIGNYTKEDEYIMRVNLGWMYSCKWYQERGGSE